MEAELKEMGARIEDLEKRLEREAAGMSKEMREEREREYRLKFGDFQASERRFQAELKDLENRLQDGGSNAQERPGRRGGPFYAGALQRRIRR
jgi:outer membrane protein